jgi:hypothetical protein
MVAMVAFSRSLRYRVSFENAELILYFVWFQTHSPLRYSCWFFMTKQMAPVVRMESNGSQALLSHDDIVDDLMDFGWVRFIKLFEGFNLEVAQAFSQTFDGAKAKIGDLQLEVTEDSIAEATGFPQEGALGSKTSNLKASLGTY